MNNGSLDEQFLNDMWAPRDAIIAYRNHPQTVVSSICSDLLDFFWSNPTISPMGGMSNDWNEADLL